MSILDAFISVLVGLFCASIYVSIYKIFKTLKYQHKKTLEYIFEAAKHGDKPVRPTQSQLNPTKKKRKGKVYKPSEDTKNILSGEIIDPYD